jgi:aspartate/methionine/tyrosine aminotransferase
MKKFFNLQLLKEQEIFNYSPTFGQTKLRKLWKDHIQELNPNIEDSLISLPIVGAGLTNCLSVVGEMFFESKNTLLLPNQIWGNYKLFYNVFQGVTIKHFNFLHKQGFDLLAFEKAIIEEEKNNLGIRIILNFPNNPTGYTPTKKEAQTICEILNKCANRGHKILIILDEAYYGLFFEDNLQKQSLFSKLYNLHENLLCIKICGATKEFFAWGFRIGFITLGIHQGNNKLYEALEKKIGGMIRATISNCSTVAQNILIKILQDKSYLQDFKKNFQILKERAHFVRDLLNQNKYNDVFEPYPFNSGYFMLIKLKNGIESEQLRKVLLKKEKIGTISTSKTDLRIAFSCLEISNIKHVFDKIYTIAKNL